MNTPAAPPLQNANVAIVIVFCSVGLASLTVLNLICDSPRWALTAPGGVIVGVIWFFASNAVRGWVRPRIGHSGARRHLGSWILEAAVSTLILWALLSAAQIGTATDRLVAASVGTAVGLVLELVIYRPPFVRPMTPRESGQ